MPAGGEQIDIMDEIHEQTRSMLLMMMVYLQQERTGGTELNGLALENYVCQMMSNIDRAIEASYALSKSLRGDANHG